MLVVLPAWRLGSAGLVYAVAVVEAAAAADVPSSSAQVVGTVAETVIAGSTQDGTVVSGVVYATWEAASVAAVTLSGGDLVATNTGTTATNQGAKVASAAGKNSGKRYFEITWTTVTSGGGSNLGAGIGTYASTYIGMGNTGGVTGVNAYFGGSVWSNGSNIDTGAGSWAAGHVMGIAVDLDNRKFWIRDSTSSGLWNHTVGANPATNTGGLTIPAGTMVPFVTFGGSGGAANNIVTANFGASAFSGTVPSGFTSGWPA